MITNRYAKKCQSCGEMVGVEKGFAYKNGSAWFTVCASSACHRRLGLENIGGSHAEREARRLVAAESGEYGFVCMPYDAAAIPLLRSMPGARFNQPDSPKNSWRVSLSPRDLPRVLEIAGQLQLEVPDSLREKAAEGTEESRAALVRAEATRCDGKTLYEFQKVGVKFLALHDRALLADDMGLGKTPMALVALPDSAAVIVICPAAVKYNWRNEAKMWRPEFKVIICSGRNSFVFPKAGEITICNYDILPSYLLPTKNSGNKTKSGKDIKVADLSDEQIKMLEQTTLISDECHLVKNFKASRSGKVTQLAKLCKNVWFLSGTPLMTRPTDLYGVLASGNMYPLGGWQKFVELFNGNPGPYGGYEFGMPKPEVPERLKRVMLRRLKTEVLKDLPPKTYQTIETNDLGAALSKRLNDYVVANAVREGLVDIEDVSSSLVKDNEKVSSLAEKLDMDTLPDFKEFSEIRALLAEARIPAMLEIVEGYEEAGVPLVVFSAHKKPVEELGKREGWGFITGDTKPETRTNLVSDFQSGKLKGIALTIQAGGIGITLTRASNILFVDLDWTPGMNIQSEDRCVRIGATADKVLIMRMTSTHPLDRHIQKLIEYKMALIYASLEASIRVTPLRPRKPNAELVDESDEELIERIRAAEEEASHTIAIGKLHSVLSRESIKVNDVPEPELTTDRKAMLRAALDYMISICDGAEKRDSMGFNKPDAFIARWVGHCLRDEDEVSYRVLERILVRYRRQLKGKFEEIWKPIL
jgi:hypothetical protein